MTVSFSKGMSNLYNKDVCDFWGRAPTIIMQTFHKLNNPFDSEDNDRVLCVSYGTLLFELTSGKELGVIIGQASRRTLCSREMTYHYVTRTGEDLWSGHYSIYCNVGDRKTLDEFNKIRDELTIISEV